jgi:hypothetical protein
MSQFSIKVYKGNTPPNHHLMMMGHCQNTFFWPRPKDTMMQLILVKVTVHPALQIVTTERRECDTRLGMIWAAWAAGGRSGRLRLHVCIDCTLSSLRRRAMRGAAAGSMLVAGASVVKKWLVALESRMAHCLILAALVAMVLRRIEAARA